MKRELSQVKNQIFVCEGLGNFPKKSSHRENSQTNYRYLNRSLQKVCCSFFEGLSINGKFQLNYSRFKSLQSKNNHNNRGRLPFLSVEKITRHFHLIWFTGLNRRTETNDNYCKLKKSIRVKASRPLVFITIEFILS